MKASGACRCGWAPMNSANLYGGVCVFAHACVRDVFAIYDNIWPRLIMIIIKIIILYFIQIRHWWFPLNEYPSSMSNSSSWVWMTLTLLVESEVISFLIIVNKTAYFVLIVCLSDLFPETSDASTPTPPGHLSDGGPSVFWMHSEQHEYQRAFLSLPKPPQVQLDPGTLVVYSARALRFEKGYRLCKVSSMQICRRVMSGALFVRVAFACCRSVALLLNSILELFIGLQWFTKPQFDLYHDFLPRFDFISGFCCHTSILYHGLFNGIYLQVKLKHKNKP